jgi:hypothetical protein
MSEMMLLHLASNIRCESLIAASGAQSKTESWSGYAASRNLEGIPCDGATLDRSHSAEIGLKNCGE